MAENAGEGSQVAQSPTNSNRSILILYGSETGNAEEIASDLGDMTQRLHFYTVVDEMDAFKLSDLLHFTLVLFVVSTTGQGDMPANVARFWKSLRRGKLNNTNCLGRVKFSVFGLGDSSYQKFNWAARKLHVRLLQLGATEFYKSGEADERHDNGIYVPWHQDLRKLLLADFPTPEDPIPTNVLLPPKYHLRLASSAATKTTGDSSAAKMENLSEAERFEATKTKSAALTHIDHPRAEAEERDVHREREKLHSIAVVARRDEEWERVSGLRADLLDKSNILTDHPSKYLLQNRDREDASAPFGRILPIPGSYTVDVVSNNRITAPNHWQDVRFITLQFTDLQKAPVDIPPGSTAIIYPKNFPQDVEEIINLMDWQSVCDKPLKWGFAARPDTSALHTSFTRRAKIFASEGSTLRDLLINNFDFMAVPKRSFIRELVHFASDEREVERLQELCSLGNEQEYYDYTSRPRRTILELLHDFPSVRVPWERILDLFPVIRGREFSIANGGNQMHENDNIAVTSIHIIAAIVEYKTIIRKPRQGLCSRYLKSLAENTLIAVRFKFPNNDALMSTLENIERPVIAIATGTGIAPIRALIQDREQWRNKARVGPVLLFFGCRSKDADYHFGDEWAEYPDLHVLPAFSRDPITEEDAQHLDPYKLNVLDRLPRERGGTGLNPKSPVDTGLYVHDYDRGKNYVQHQIRRHADKVCALMERQPLVCICGNSGRMPISVRQALFDALVVGGFAKTEVDAKGFLTDPRYVTLWQETW
ncbi:riboflavin synthase domain-like protein [Thozetella sp. PMI_491]|nr:riboflavin synthase domain-like protein [Thozetella sp. PMI_491]